jgi:hypothetical protein
MVVSRYFRSDAVGGPQPRRRKNPRHLPTATADSAQKGNYISPSKLFRSHRVLLVGAPARLLALVGGRAGAARLSPWGHPPARQDLPRRISGWRRRTN